jgi:uncharacterized cupin superfamily protein
MSERPSFIANIHENLEPQNQSGRPGFERLNLPIGSNVGLVKMGIHHQVLPPGSRTSYPHAESHEEEFVLVLKGTPDVWIDGELYELVEGDAVGFPAGTGIAHSFLNNSDADVSLLVLGEVDKAENKLNYPTNPERMVQFAARGAAWLDAPKHKLGPHDGVPRAGTRKH